MPEETSETSPDAVPEEPPAQDEPPSDPLPDPPRPHRRRRQPIALIAGGVLAAMAVAVAVIALTASPANPYATPGSACALVSPGTVAKYVPGRVHGKRIGNACDWDAGTNGGLVVFAYVLDNAAQARTGFAQVV